MNQWTNLFDLSDRRALVVGAGGGIGGEVAAGLAGFGARVECADIDAEAAGHTAASITADGGSAGAREFDMGNPDAVTDAARQLADTEVLVVTPAINVRKRLVDTTAEEFHRVVALNLEGTFHIVREFGARMAERGRGSIICFSSVRAQVVEPGQGVYAATKAGVLQMVRALASELGPYGVRANVVAPGVVETPLTEQIKQQPQWYDAYADKTILERWASPREMVGAVVFLASQASSYVTGSYLAVDGGWLAADGRYTPPL